ncbi:MAG TPA: sodium:proton antiporter [Abditibacterium sp.]
MTFELSCLLAGILFLGMALIPNRLQHWPLTTSVIYLGVGLLMGPLVFDKIQLSPFENAALLERLTEVTVLISLFAAGLKLRLPFSNRRWLVPLSLAVVSMTITVALIAAAGVFWLGLPLGAAILLGAILSPTDPVLASDVQVQHSKDNDRLRFSLTGEAGFNDGTAFPFVMLGLGLLGLHDLGAGGWKWFTVDVLWSIAAGISIGAVLGSLVARLVVFLRAKHKEATGSDDFLALGLIAGTYGIALLCHSYGFLAVFAAGIALRQAERVHTKIADQKRSGESAEAEPITVPMDDAGMEELREELATDPDRAASVMAREVLSFNEALERIAELGLVVLLGAMMSAQTWTNDALWLAPLLFLVIRPISIFFGLLGTRKIDAARPFIAWFGVRGIGSLFYLFYAMQHGLSPELAQKLVPLTFSVVAISIVVHGLSVTPLMKIYERTN